MQYLSFRQLVGQQFFFRVSFNAAHRNHVKIYKNSKLWAERLSENGSNPPMFDSDKNTSGDTINWAIENGSEGESTDGEKLYQSDMQLVFGFEDGGSGNEHDDAKVIIDFLIEDKDAYLEPNTPTPPRPQPPPPDLAINHVRIEWVVDGRDTGCGARGRTFIKNSHPTKIIRVYYYYLANPNSPYETVVNPNERKTEACGEGKITGADYL